MQSRIDNYYAIANELKEGHKSLTEFERLSLAVQIERNQILENGLNVNRADASPSSLEAIAMSLGYTDQSYNQTITEVLKSK